MNRLEIRIFISSTFGENMVNARDAFRNEILAKLNAVAGQIQGNVFLNDFELGIPEGTDALTVVCTCLNAIMESDYFVGIMGEERGTLVSEYLVDSEWTETRYSSLIHYAINHRLTVLELEFLCAVTCGIKAFYYLSTEQALSAESRFMEKFLFEHNQCITGFDSVEALKKNLLERMEAEWNIKYDFFSRYNQEEKDINIIIANKTRYYVQNTGCIRNMDDYINSESTKVLYITGQSGIGKSTALFDWFNTNVDTDEYHILFFAAEHISSSIDELLEYVLHEIEDIENKDYLSGYHEMRTDMERIQYFKTVLNDLVQPYVMLIDGLEHVFSHMGIRTKACLPVSLKPNVKIITTWNDDISEDESGINYTPEGFDVESFTKLFFEKEGKILIYRKYGAQISALMQECRKPDTARLMLSYIILCAKYNNIADVLLEFTVENRRYNNPYCSYLVLLNRYFTYDENEPLKEALLLLYHSKNGVSISMLESVVASGDKLQEIFNVIYFLLQKNTYNRYILKNEYVRKALEVLYPSDIESYEIRFSNLNSLELLSKKGRMEESFDIWEEYLESLVRNKNNKELERVFTVYLGQIANLWYYNRELLLRVFELVKSSSFIEKLKEQAIEDTESNAPFFVSHLFMEYGYLREAIEIYEYLLANNCKEKLSEKDLATVFNNIGLALCSIGENEAGEQYLLQGYQKRKRLFVENKTAYFESCDNLAEFYLQNGDSIKAAEYLNEATEVCETCFQKNSPEQMKCYVRRAALEEISAPLNALFYYDQALKISDAIFGTESLQSAKILQQKGIVYLRMEEARLAMECGMRAANAYEKMGIYNDDLFYIYNLAGSAALLVEKQELTQKDLTIDSKSWFKKALNLIGKLDLEMYETNLEQLKSDLPDVPVEFWISN